MAMGYFFQNHINCVTQQDDWCYDPATKTITMYSTSTPTGVKVSNTDSLVSFSSSKNYNIFSNISFDGGNSYGIYGNYGGTNNQVNNCVLTNIGIYTIYLGGANTCTVSNNTIANSVNNSIYLSDAVSCNIVSNTIDGTGQIAGMGQSSDGTTGTGNHSGIEVGFSLTSSKNTLKGNTILNSGYNGILISGDAFLIDSNYVDTACTILNDGGCIYTSAGFTGHVYSNRTISNNIVLNCTGNLDGTTATSQAVGIYCDDNTSNITISNNTAYNCGQYGFYHHNNHEVISINNLAYNNAVAQFAIQHDNIATNLPLPINFTICNNVLIANSATQLCFSFRNIASNSTVTDFVNLGVCNNNYYGSLFSNTNLFSTQLTGFSTVLRNFASWQSYTTEDANSLVSFPSYTSIRFDYNVTQYNSTFTLAGTYTDFPGNIYTGDFTLAPFTSSLLLETTGGPGGSATVIMNGKRIILL